MALLLAQLDAAAEVLVPARRMQASENCAGIAQELRRNCAAYDETIGEPTKRGISSAYAISGRGRERSSLRLGDAEYNDAAELDGRSFASAFARAE